MVSYIFHPPPTPHHTRTHYYQLYLHWCFGGLCQDVGVCTARAWQIWNKTDKSIN